MAIPSGILENDITGDHVDADSSGLNKRQWLTRRRMELSAGKNS